jgi:hypothetical protein
MLYGRTGPLCCAPARRWACLALSVLTAALAAGGCTSSGNRRDQNYGKDVGTVYQPSEAGVDTAAPADGGTAETNDATPSVGDGGADTTDGADDAPSGDAG